MIGLMRVNSMNVRLMRRITTMSTAVEERQGNRDCDHITCTLQETVSVECPP
jgi:hypothetical protein